MEFEDFDQFLLDLRDDGNFPDNLHEDFSDEESLFLSETLGSSANVSADHSVTSAPRLLVGGVLDTLQEVLNREAGPSATLFGVSSIERDTSAPGPSGLVLPFAERRPELSLEIGSVIPSFRTGKDEVGTPTSGSASQEGRVGLDNRMSDYAPLQSGDEPRVGRGTSDSSSEGSNVLLKSETTRSPTRAPSTLIIGVIQYLLEVLIRALIVLVRHRWKSRRSGYPRVGSLLVFV
jgi:hypothetical protein